MEFKALLHCCLSVQHMLTVTIHGWQLFLGLQACGDGHFKTNNLSTLSQDTFCNGNEISERVT